MSGAFSLLPHMPLFVYRDSFTFTFMHSVSVDKVHSLDVIWGSFSLVWFIWRRELWVYFRLLKWFSWGLLSSSIILRHIWLQLHGDLMPHATRKETKLQFCNCIYCLIPAEICMVTAFNFSLHIDQNAWILFYVPF